MNELFSNWFRSLQERRSFEIEETLKPQRLYNSLRHGDKSFLGFPENLESCIVWISIIEEIETEIFSTDYIPEANGCQQVIGIHFIMEVCFFTIYFFQIINNLYKPFHIVFLVQARALVWGFLPYHFKILILVWIGGATRIINIKSSSASQRGPAWPPRNPNLFLGVVVFSILVFLVVGPLLWVRKLKWRFFWWFQHLGLH